MAQDNVVIVNGARTAMGGFQGSLAALSAPRLGAASIREAVARAGLNAADIEDVIMGCVLPAGLGQGPARQAMRLAGLPDGTGATTINKLCGSGMRATMFGHDMIKAGSHDIVVSGGMESMSNAPYVLEKARAGYRMGHGKVLDHMFLDGLEDAETGRLMGSFAQDVADQRGITREQMDDFAIESLKRAHAAIGNGWFADEIVPVTVQTRKGETVVDTDEQPGTPTSIRFPISNRRSRKTAPSPPPTPVRFPMAPRRWCWPANRWPNSAACNRWRAFLATPPTAATPASSPWPRSAPPRSC